MMLHSENFVVLTEEMRAEFGLHKKARIKDLPPKVLAVLLSIEQLMMMVATDYFGNHWEALKLKDKDTFRRIDHQQWDLTLSHMGGQRICGFPNNKECPFPFEDDLNFWIETRYKDENKYFNTRGQARSNRPQEN